MAELTTSSYLILGMLTTRDWSAYELAGHIKRGLTEVWPRAERGMYNVPKRLADEGLVTATHEMVGRRQRTIYSITSTGRTALKQWLKTESKAPSLEFEAMIHVLLADQGELTDLRRTLATTLRQAREGRDLFQSLWEYRDSTDGGMFPERRHLSVLANKFMLGHYSHMAEWAEWALAETDSWSHTRLSEGRSSTQSE